MKHLKPLTFSFFFCLLLASLAQAGISFAPMAGLAARVGGVDITMKQLDRAIDSARFEVSLSLQGFGSDLVSREETSASKDQSDLEIIILDQLIEDVLVEQGAKEEGVKVSENDIQEEIAKLKKRFPSNEEFHRTIAQQGMTLEDLKKTIRKQLLVAGLEKILMGRIAVSDEEIRSFYDKNIDLFIQPKKVALADILVRDEELALFIRASLEAGADFAEMAKAYSADFRTRGKGGDMGFVTVEDLEPMLEKSAFHLNAGEISEVIETDDGFHIIKVLVRVPGKETSFEMAKDNIRIFILKEKASDAFSLWLESRRVDTKIEINEKFRGLYEGKPSSELYDRLRVFDLTLL